MFDVMDSLVFIFTNKVISYVTYQTLGVSIFIYLCPKNNNQICQKVVQAKNDIIIYHADFSQKSKIIQSELFVFRNIS